MNFHWSNSNIFLYLLTVTVSHYSCYVILLLDMQSQTKERSRKNCNAIYFNAHIDCHRAKINWHLTVYIISLIKTFLCIYVYLFTSSRPTRHVHCTVQTKERSWKNCNATSTYLLSRRPVGSTNQAYLSCFYCIISWILMEQHFFIFFCPLRFVQGLRSLKHWLLQKLSMKNLDQKFKFLIEK